MIGSFPTHHPTRPAAPRWLRTAIPAVVYPVVVLSAAFYLPLYAFLERKEGFIEICSVLMGLFGVGAGILLLARHRAALPAKWLVGWFALATVGMFWMAGEELSWGQQLGFWTHDDVPEVIRKYNEQDESNLHNMHPALNVGLVNLIWAGTLFAFAGLPLLQRLRRQTMTPENPGYWFWPTPSCRWAALGVLIIPFPSRFYKLFTGEEKVPWTWGHSEFSEFYIATLMAVYMADALARASALDPRRKPAPSDPNNTPG